MTYSPQHLDRLRLRHLRLLELIDVHRSLRAVGKVLNLTQPAVSQMVKDLEYAFGVQLVDRSVRGVALSDAGRLALQRVRAGLATFDHLVTELQSDQPLKIRIGTNSAMMYQILPAALRRVDIEKTGMAFMLRTGTVGEMMQALWDGELDCYVGRVDWDQMPKKMVSVLRHVPLTRMELVLACPVDHPLARRANLTVNDLAGWHWALPPEDSNNRIVLDAELRNHGLSGPTPVVEVAADPNALMNLASQLNLLTCVPLPTLQAHIAAGGLCALELPNFHLPPIHIGIVTLTEHDDMVPLKILRQAVAEAVALGENGIAQ